MILFLHGAGERGQDGITPAQVGIGPAIFNRPRGVPALVVFPQARADLGRRLGRQQRRLARPSTT